jgi:5-formyltetrahydrofolate cyclo-ligase
MDSNQFLFHLDPLDLFLLPGVAFTASGKRCGHGRGYYDKYLARYFQRYPEKCMDRTNKTVLIGLAFKEQMVDSFKMPLDPYDFPLDLVLTSDSD